MINWFISSVSRIFGGRRPKPPTGRALTPVHDAMPPVSVGEEEIAVHGIETPPGDNNNATRVDPVVMANAIASMATSRLAKLLSQQSKDATASLAQTLADLRALIADNLNAHGKKVGDDVLRRLDKQCRYFQTLLDRGLPPLGDRIIEAVKKDSESHWAVLRKEMTEACSATTQRAAQRPIVDQLIALYDRINDERAFLNASYRKEPDLALQLGCRQLQERSDSAVRSFASEVLIILRTVGVEPIAAGAGPFDPVNQRVVGVEPTSRADLDGHVSRIVRAGFVWAGTLLRPESVYVFKKGA